MLPMRATKMQSVEFFTGDVVIKIPDGCKLFFTFPF